jgi:hypothetical protein
MNKVVLVSIVVSSLFFSSCVTKLSFKVDKDINQEKYIQEPNYKIPESSSILVIGAFANKETRYFVKYLEENLEKNNYFNVIISERISEQYPSYPCYVVSPGIEVERNYSGIVPGYESNDNKKIEEIGQAFNADYVFMAYLDRTKKIVRYSTEFFSSKYELGFLSTIKGTLWDISKNQAIGQSYYYISDSKKMKFGMFVDNIYSKTEELIKEISKEAADDIAKRIIRENE